MITYGTRIVIDRALLRINVQRDETVGGKGSERAGTGERERSEEAWYNGINRSTSQHHTAATVGETWNINQNIRLCEKIEQ